MPAWVIPAIMAGASLAQTMLTPKDKDLDNYIRQLRMKSIQGIGAGQKLTLYNEGGSQIAGEAGESRRISGANMAAMGVGRSSTMSNTMSAINAQQSAALSGLRRDINAFDEQTKQNAMAALGGALEQRSASRLGQQATAGRALGQSAMLLQNVLYPQANPFANWNRIPTE